jgi:hypothetical protein
LAYYYIYGDGKASMDTRRLRHDLWTLRGFLDRQEFRCISRDKVHIVDAEKKIIADILSRIESNPAFMSLSPKQQTKAREGCWRLNHGWADLAEIAGFDRQVFEDVYSYLCSYAHSGGLSTLQISQAVSQEDQQRLSLHSRYCGILLMGHFIMSFAGLFPDTKGVLGTNARAADLARRRALTWREPEFRKYFGQEGREE